MPDINSSDYEPWGYVDSSLPGCKNFTVYLDGENLTKKYKGRIRAAADAAGVVDLFVGDFSGSVPKFEMENGVPKTERLEGRVRMVFDGDAATQRRWMRLYFVAVDAPGARDAWGWEFPHLRGLVRVPSAGVVDDCDAIDARFARLMEEARKMKGIRGWMRRRRVRRDWNEAYSDAWVASMVKDK